MSPRIAQIIAVGFIFCAVACGGRMPNQDRTVSLIRKHFNHYGKEYPTSPFGNKKVQGVEILSTEEIHKGLISATAFVTMEGPEVFKIRMTLEKKALGWRTIHWENLSGE